jgi:hypothetical protein
VARREVRRLVGRPVGNVRTSAGLLAHSRGVRSARIHTATRNLTGDIVRAQRSEIEQFEEWLVEWYAN